MVRDAFRRAVYCFKAAMCVSMCVQMLRILCIVMSGGVQQAPEVVYEASGSTRRRMAVQAEAGGSAAKAGHRRNLLQSPTLVLTLRHIVRSEQPAPNPNPEQSTTSMPVRTTRGHSRAIV